MYPKITCKDQISPGIFHYPPQTFLLLQRFKEKLLFRLITIHFLELTVGYLIRRVSIKFKVSSCHYSSSFKVLCSPSLIFGSVLNPKLYHLQIWSPVRTPPFRIFVNQESLGEKCAYKIISHCLIFHEIGPVWSIHQRFWVQLNFQERGEV